MFWRSCFEKRLGLPTSPKKSTTFPNLQQGLARARDVIEWLKSSGLLDRQAHELLIQSHRLCRCLASNARKRGCGSCGQEEETRSQHCK